MLFNVTSVFDDRACNQLFTGATSASLAISVLFRFQTVVHNALDAIQTAVLTILDFLEVPSGHRWDLL